MNIQEFEDRFKLISKKFNEIKNHLDIKNKKIILNDLESKTVENDFWNNPNESNLILKKIKNIKKELDFYSDIDNQYHYILMHIDEFNDDYNLEDSTIKELLDFSSLVDQLEIKMLLNDSDDERDVILTIHPGAGGTESQDWVSMLYRMYVRWIDDNDCKYKILNYHDGDDAGIKDVSIQIEGNYVFGQLKCERGVHRLIRISPFDSNSKRHTSFAAVFIDPIVDDDVDININDNDIKIDTFRASGAGGQHVNKTDSAVRIKHLETGIVVQCQNQRSQLKNKNTAIKMLKSKLYQFEKERKEAEKDITNKDKKDIGWGSQIRTYTFHPYNLVKDHRTNFEISDVNSVMDGNINKFIRSCLLNKMENK